LKSSRIRHKPKEKNRKKEFRTGAYPNFIFHFSFFAYFEVVLPLFSKFSFIPNMLPGVCGMKLLVHASLDTSLRHATLVRLYLLSGLSHFLSTQRML